MYVEIGYVHVSVLPVGTIHSVASYSQTKGLGPGLICLEGCSFEGPI